MAEVYLMHIDASCLRKFTSMYTGFLHFYLEKNSRTSQDHQNVFLGPSRSIPVFKYKDSNYLLYIPSVIECSKFFIRFMKWPVF